MNPGIQMPPPVAALLVTSALLTIALNKVQEATIADIGTGYVVLPVGGTKPTPQQAATDALLSAGVAYCYRQLTAHKDDALQHAVEQLLYDLRQPGIVEDIMADPAVHEDTRNGFDSSLLDSPFRILRNALEHAITFRKNPAVLAGTYAALQRDGYATVHSIPSVKH